MLLEKFERPLLTPDEAAYALAVSRETVYRLLRSGRLPSVRVGSQYRIPAADLASKLQETGSGLPARRQ
jgi:excisionase family DNA binding protein